MSPQERREVVLAFIELAAVFHPAGSPERAAWAEMWDEAQALSGNRIDESRLVPAVVFAMRQAAHNLTIGSPLR